MQPVAPIKRRMLGPPAPLKAEPSLSERSYPSRAVMQRYLTLAKQNGIQVTGFRVDPTNGAIEVFEARSDTAPPAESPFERWEREQSEKSLPARLKAFAQGKSTQTEQPVEAKHSDRDVYTPAQLAELWGTTKEAVMRAIKSGELPSFKIGTRMYRVRRDRAEAYARHNP